MEPVMVSESEVVVRHADTVEKVLGRLK